MHPDSPLWFLTDFADQAVILPLSLVVAITLWCAGWRRGALAWAGIVGVTFAIVAGAKLAVFVFGPPGFLPNLHSPSGHTAAAALIYGSLVALLASRANPRSRALMVACFVAVGIGTTRLALHVHTRSDVVIGAAIGIAAATLLAWAAGRRPDGVRVLIPTTVTLLVILVFHGVRLPVEVWLHEVAHTVKAEIRP